jgi:hypothetical protein
MKCVTGMWYPQKLINERCMAIFYHLAASSETNNRIQCPDLRTNEFRHLGI